MVAKSGSDSEKTRYRTAIIPVTLSGANYRLAHNSCHSAALLWNQAVDFVHGEWKAKRSPSKYAIQVTMPISWTTPLNSLDHC